MEVPQEKIRSKTTGAKRPFGGDVPFVPICGYLPEYDNILN